MPVAFLTAEQRSRYGCYVGEPSPEQLALYFHLDDRDRSLLEPRRHDHTRLGFALQLCTVRFLGTFLSDPTDVPHIVVLTLAAQLNIADPTVLSRYLEGQMRYDHVHEIMAEYGYQDFAAQPAHFRFLRWLYTRAWWSEERLTVLFDLAMAHLIDRKVLLPGVSVLERAVASVREHATTRLWQRLAQIWGGGYVASVDGLRFVVPVRSINTGPNPHYFGQGRGVYVTWNWGLWYHWNIKRTWRGHADIHRSRIHRVVPLSRAC